MYINEQYDFEKIKFEEIQPNPSLGIID